MICSRKVVAPLLHSLPDGQELLIVHVIVLFCACIFSRVEVDRFENPETVILVENAKYGRAACIGLQNNRLCWIDIAQD
jgi:hypothetical protein